MKNIFLGALALGLAALTVPTADAAPISSSFAVRVWYASGFPNPDLQTDPQMQALPSNPVVAPGNLLAAFNYSGDLNFSQGGSGPGNIGTFIGSGGGTVTGLVGSLNHILSNGGFDDATIMSFTFTTGAAISGSILHDDGISIALGNFTNQNVFVDSSSPTNTIATSFSLAANTQYTLWYAEVNGLPAVLQTNVPEPASLLLLGAGFIGLGMARRRSSKAKLA